MNVPLWAVIAITIGGWILLEGIKVIYQLLIRKISLTREYKTALVQKRLNIYEEVNQKLWNLVFPETKPDILDETHNFVWNRCFYMSRIVRHKIAAFFVLAKSDFDQKKLIILLPDINEVMRKDIYNPRIEKTWKRKRNLKDKENWNKEFLRSLGQVVDDSHI